MDIYFSADHHFFHENIRTYCNRPFVSGKEMNAVMIERWNATVKPDDIVYHLGDFAFLLPLPRLKELVASLNGTKFLIKGNHDKSISRMKEAGFRDGYRDLLFRHPSGTDLYLSHKPNFAFNNQYPGAYHLCGHVHGLWARSGCAIYNVGVDVRNFTPVTLEELLGT
jgi:calcineurin-like phosphoesterase family protein